MKQKTKQELKEMTDQVAKEILVELGSTKYWQAIRWYNKKFDADIVASLISIDPFKEPTLMARRQGQRTGVYGIELFVNDEIKRRTEESKKKKGKSGVGEQAIPNYSM